MRRHFCKALVNKSNNPNMVVLTGDLGFMTLEPLQEVLQDRFINAGVAEQNMISVSAAMARAGLEVWVYTIAPFCYARPFEQIRNDISFHDLPVKLVGNGGGYGYGVMGPTHHSIEDYGVLLTLPNMRVFIPVFNEDIDAMVNLASKAINPVYIRMGMEETPIDFKAPKYAPWRQLTNGGGMVVIVAGPMAGTYIAAFNALSEKIRPNLWIVTELPLRQNPLPIDLLKQISSRQSLCVIEEHVSHGGVGSEIALFLLKEKIKVDNFHHLYARSHHYATYGSQNFLRAQSGIDAKSVLAVVAP
jgi:transketolase